MCSTYGTDMTELAKMGKLDPVIGREKEIEQVIEALMNRRKSNACLVGDAGVGKTAIAEGLAIKIAEGSVPPQLIGKKLISLDINRLIGGAILVGMFEGRLKQVLDDVRRSNGSIILFIDELHTIILKPGAADVLKPALARGEFMCIGATTLEEYTRHMEKDTALKRRFQRIHVCEPSRDGSIHILNNIIHKYQAHYKVKYTQSAIVAAVDLSKHYMRELFLPDKAIDIISKAGARAQLQGRTFVTEVEIQNAVAACTGIPVNKLSIDEMERLMQLENTIKQNLVGQDEAVAAVCRAIRRARIGIRDETKPIGCFLFTGPTGVGKTETAKVVANDYFGSKEALVRLDMSEFMLSHNVARLIGSPPGYVHHEDGGQLTEAVRRRPHSLVLFDEIEKAHPKVLDLLLQILDDGRLADAKGRTVDFSNTIIILTSNVGSSWDELRAADFKPELLNRFDQIVAFQPLEKDHVHKILEILINDFCSKLASVKKIKLEVSKTLKEVLISEGYDERYGARALKRAFARLVKDKLAEEILNGAVAPEDCIMMDVGEGGEVSCVKIGSTHQDLGLCSPSPLLVVKNQYWRRPSSFDLSHGLAQVFDCI